MQLQLNPGQQSFSAEVAEFLARHWRPTTRLPDQREADAFHRALVTQGWSVPDWPEQFGGSGWTPEQRYLFKRLLAQSGAPLLDGFSVDVFGPLLMQRASSDQLERYLPAVREARGRCCPHWSLAGGPPLEVEVTREGVVLVAQQTGAQSAAGASWMLAVGRATTAHPAESARPGAPATDLLVVLELAPGSTTPGLPLDPDEVALQGGARADVLGPWQSNGSSFSDALAAFGPPVRSLAPALHRQLLRVAEMLDPSQPDAGGLRRRLHELQIGAVTLDAMEARTALDARSDEAEARAAWLRGAELAAETAALAVDAAGYMALPGLDSLTLDNEGPIGGDYQRAVQALFRYVGGLEAMIERERIAALKG